MAGEPGLRLVPSTTASDVDVLVGEVARGDSHAFEQLYDELSAPSRTGAAGRAGPTRAEDVTQEVFLEVWRKAPRFDSSSARPRPG